MRKHERPPAWFRLFPREFLTDPRVERMTPEEFGVHCYLLMRAWIDGGIPADPNELARYAMLRGMRREKLERLWRAVSPCWELAANGRRINPQQEAEREHIFSVKAARSRAGSASAAQKSATSVAADQGDDGNFARRNPLIEKERGPAYVEGVLNTNRTHVQHLPNYTDTDKDKDKDREQSKSTCCACGATGLPLDEFFEQRYRAHPKKRDRTLAEQYMSQIPGIETAETQDEFRRGHDAWIRSEEWRWKNGAKAPTFAQFILDQSWKYPPPDEEDSGEIPMISTEEFERLHPPSSEGVDPYAEWIPPWEDEKRKREVAAKAAADAQGD